MNGEDSEDKARGVLQISSRTDDFISLFTQEEACVLVDLLKIGVAGRAGPDAKQIIASMLLGKNN